MSAEAGPSNGVSATSSEAVVAAPAQTAATIPISFFVDDTRHRLSDADASAELEKVVASIVKAQGYDSIEASALDYVMTSVEAVMGSLLQHAQDLAQVGRRRTPSARDCYIALLHAGPRIRPHCLQRFAKGRKMLPAVTSIAVEEDASSQLPSWCAPYDSWLASDDEDEARSTIVDRASEEAKSKGRGGTTAYTKKRRVFRPHMDEVPSHLPELPPKHTWLKTPSFPIRSEDTIEPMALIDIKVSATRLTEASLRNLISTTDHAAFNSRLQHKTGMESDSHMAGAAAHPSFKTDVFNGGTRTDRPRQDSIGGGRFAVLSSNVTTPPAADDNTRRNRTRTMKGRALSLRLRTPSSSQISDTISTAPAQENGHHDSTSAAQKERIAVKRPFPPLHRSSLSLSISGGQTPPRIGSATPVSAFGAHRRQMSASVSSQGPWTATPSQSYFTWGPPTPGMTPSGEMLPLATPLTPGAGFIYPPTPSDLYNNASASFGDHESQGDTERGEGDVTLPGVVNFKRSWYKKSHTVKQEDD